MTGSQDGLKRWEKAGALVALILVCALVVAVLTGGLFGWLWLWGL